jgi:hypothetical protein
VVIGGGDDTLCGNIRDPITGREVEETLHRTGKSVLSDEDVRGRLRNRISAQICTERNVDRDRSNVFKASIGPEVYTFVCKVTSPVM